MDQPSELVPYDSDGILRVTHDFSQSTATLQIEHVPYLRPSNQSYVDDFRDMRTTRLFEGGTDPCDVNGQQLATIINFAVRVGQGTETLKNLAELVKRLGVRRTS